MEEDWTRIDEIVVKKMPPLFSDERLKYDRALQEQYQASLRAYGQRQKDSPVKYIPQPKIESRNTKWISDLVVPLAKLVGVVTGIAGGASLLWSMFIAAKIAVTAWITANGGIVTGVAAGIAAVAGLWAWTRKSSDREAERVTHNHYHQYNNQGPGGQQNNT